jgi:hypothetical protein
MWKILLSSKKAGWNDERIHWKNEENLDEFKSVPKDEFKEDLKNVLKTVIKIWKKSGVAWRIKGTKW